MKYNYNSYMDPLTYADVKNKLREMEDELYTFDINYKNYQDEFERQSSQKEDYLRKFNKLVNDMTRKVDAATLEGNFDLAKALRIKIVELKNEYEGVKNIVQTQLDRIEDNLYDAKVKYNSTLAEINNAKKLYKKEIREIEKAGKKLPLGEYLQSMSYQSNMTPNEIVQIARKQIPVYQKTINKLSSDIQIAENEIDLYDKKAKELLRNAKSESEKQAIKKVVSKNVFILQDKVKRAENLMQDAISDQKSLKTLTKQILKSEKKLVEDFGTTYSAAYPEFKQQRTASSRPIDPQREERRLELKRLADERNAVFRRNQIASENIIKTAVDPIQPEGTLPVVPPNYRFQAVEALVHEAERENMSQIVNTPTVDVHRSILQYPLGNVNVNPHAVIDLDKPELPVTTDNDTIKKMLMKKYYDAKEAREARELQDAEDFFEDEQYAKALAYAYPIKIAKNEVDPPGTIEYFTNPVPNLYSDIEYEPSQLRGVYRTQYKPIEIPNVPEYSYSSNVPEDSFSSLSINESNEPEIYNGKSDLERLKNYSNEFVNKMSKFSKKKYDRMVKWLNDTFNVQVSKGKKLVFSGLSPQGEMIGTRRVPLTTAVGETFKDITQYIGDKSDVIKQYLQSLMRNPDDPYDPANDDWSDSDLVKVPSKFSIVASNLYKLINQNAIKWFKDVTKKFPKNKGELADLMSNALNYFKTVTDFTWMDRMKDYASKGSDFLAQHGSELWKSVVELIKKEGPGIAKSILMAALISLGTIAAKKAFEYIFPSEARPDEIVHKHILPKQTIGQVDLELLLQLLKKPEKPGEDHSLYIKNKIDNMLKAKIEANWDWEGYGRNRLVPSTKYGY